MKTILTIKQRAIIERLDHSIYTPEFIEEWINRNDTIDENAPGALQAMGAKGFYSAVFAIEKLELNMD